MLERLQSGEGIETTVNGIPTATLAEFHPARNTSLTKAELPAHLPRTSDLMLARDIAVLREDSTDDLGPIL